jgi:hypothetical protein
MSVGGELTVFTEERRLDYGVLGCVLEAFGVGDSGFLLRLGSFSPFDFPWIVWVLEFGICLGLFGYLGNINGLGKIGKHMISK